MRQRKLKSSRKRTRTRKNRTRTRKNSTRTRKNSTRTRKQRGGAEGIDKLTDKLNRREMTLESLKNEGLPIDVLQDEITQLRADIALLQVEDNGPKVGFTNISTNKVFYMKVSDIKDPKLNEENFMNRISDGLDIKKENISAIIRRGKKLGPDRSDFSFKELKHAVKENESIHVVMKKSLIELMFQPEPEPEPESEHRTQGLSKPLISSYESTTMPPERQSKPIVKEFNNATYVLPDSEAEENRIKLVLEESKNEAEKERLKRLEKLKNEEDKKDKLIRQEAQKKVDDALEANDTLEKIAFENKKNDRVLQRLALHVVKTELDEINKKSKSNMELVLTLTNKNEELLKELMTSNYFYIERPDSVKLLTEILDQFRNMRNPAESHDDSSYELPSGLLDGLSDSKIMKITEREKMREKMTEDEKDEEQKRWDKEAEERLRILMK